MPTKPPLKNPTPKNQIRKPDAGLVLAEVVEGSWVSHMLTKRSE
jgi:hypothetical protein